MGFPFTFVTVSQLLSKSKSKNGRCVHLLADTMDEHDDVTRRALVELNMHCITKEMVASHVLLHMPSMAGKTSHINLSI